MALTINSNITSLNAQRNLNNTTNSLTKSMGRLSSGLRINSAKDDSAGLAIANRMTSQVRGMDQAVRNANDGISLVQTAEGAMQEVTTNLQRIRELSIQASSETYSAADRESLNNEVQQLVAEIDRVASNTQYNGVNLLDGSFGSKDIQIGANSGQSVSLSMTNVKANALGIGSASYSTSVSGGVSAGPLEAGDLTLNGYEIEATSDDGVSFASGNASAISIANAINAESGDTGVTASVAIASVEGVGRAEAAITSKLSANDVKINGVAIGAIASAGSNAERASDIAAAINAISDQTGVTASFTTSGGVSLTSIDGRNITVSATTAATQATTGIATAALGETTHSSVNLSSSSADGITIGGADESQAGLEDSAGNNAAELKSGTGLSLSSAGAASSAIDIVDEALAKIDSARGNLGSMNNRFESAISNLQNASENTSAARSRIMDADFAAETAAMTKAQVMQQAGTAMLAQANQLPQAALSLLQ